MEHTNSAEPSATRARLAIDKRYDVVLDRCRTGLTIYDASGIKLGLARKPTRLRTTSFDVALKLDLTFYSDFFIFQ